MKTFFLLLAVLISFGSVWAVGMVGGPVFCLGERMTSMSVELSKINMQVHSPADNGKDAEESMTSQRVFLNGRYGVTPWMDLEGRVGTADLRFSDSPQGYSAYDSDLSLAWGAGVRFGYPFEKTPYQVTLATSYTGYKASGSSTKGMKIVSTNYLWQEISQSATFGYKFGKFLPYVGMTKPYLFGKRDVAVVFAGQEFSTAGGEQNYSDGKQPIRGILGLEWKLPEGYSMTAEMAGTTGGIWMLFLGFSQVLK
jgi:hypothetical protein